MNGFVLAGVAIAAFAAGAALVSFRYERELRRMARFLDQREPTGNARMTAFVRTRGVLGIARGVNAELFSNYYDNTHIAELIRAML